MKRPEKKSESLEIRLPYSQKQAFMEACRERGVTASDVLRSFIADDLESQAAPPQEERTWSMTLKNNPLKTAASLAGAALAAAAFGAGASFADDEVFSAYDKNGDGVISYSEFAGARGGNVDEERRVERRIVRMDKATGEVLSEEVEGAGPPAPPPPGRAYARGGEDAMAKLFTGMDANHDGVLSEDEFEGKGSFSKRSVETTERDGKTTKVIMLERVSYDIEDETRRSISISAESRVVDADATDGEIEQAFRDLEEDMKEMERNRPQPPMPPEPRRG
ncbi:EF-hand domain-containing protein [Parvularcula lutaonensis]|uniref:EF-hand domain-containing protein n=1 Tax=Parvularcula lutaonensis TaxID=491923 RepID=A0ABV7M9J8_9PROT|nr:EF-hand domain-containing protein [Parvularcula lutaonensis]GGY47235.1 hypothetical protein GCM10007148_15660 [Parvularcula lutaonensis]